jgi:hypothetical protein
MKSPTLLIASVLSLAMATAALAQEPPLTPQHQEQTMHYRNGREAKVGDLLVGTVYNTTVDGKDDSPKKVIAGTLVKAVPGSDTCNAEVEWVEHVPPIHKRPRMATADLPRLSIQPVDQSGTLEVRVAYLCRDYTHVGALLHVEDAWDAGRIASANYVHQPAAS